jgi:hypothetical protein
VDQSKGLGGLGIEGVVGGAALGTEVLSALWKQSPVWSRVQYSFLSQGNFIYQRGQVDKSLGVQLQTSHIYNEYTLWEQFPPSTLRGSTAEYLFLRHLGSINWHVPSP